MRKVKLFFLLTALAIAQGTLADSKTFTSFNQGENTQSPVTVHCSYVSSNRAKLYSSEAIAIIVSAGYTITEVKFSVYRAYSTNAITVTHGTLSTTNPYEGATVTVSNVNDTQTTLQSKQGDYSIDQIQVTYTANTYSVSYNGNGSTSGSTASQTKTHGVTLQLRSNGYSRTGYTFSKWNTQANGKGTNYNAGANYTVNAAATMYAQWTVNTYKVRFNGNGSTGGSMSDQNFTYGTAQNLTANAFSKTGHTFAGWATSPTGAKVYNNQQSVTNLTATNGGTVNLYAKWTVNQYTIKFNNYNGTQLQSSQVNYGATPTYTGATPTKPSTAAYTYTFNGWSPAIATVTGNATYTAQFTEQINQATVDAAIALINAIDNPVVYTNECHQEILDARTAYDALSDEQKALVDATTLQKLTDAEADYDALEADHNAANAVIALINAIDDPVVYTDACHQEILDAREAYDNLTQAQKDLIDASTLQKLTDAEDAYASLNVDITAKLDPVNDGVYYSTFYDGSRQLQLPANVEAYTATVSGDKMLLKKVAVAGDILPAATAVVLRASQADFTLTPSAASPVSVENNALRGTDVNMEVPSEHCYVLSGADGFVGFYPLSAPYTLSAHKAFIDLDNLPGGANNAPRRLRFVFSEEQTTTGMENVQNEETKAQKVMIDGVMYIIRGEHMYDAQGQIVK